MFEALHTKKNKSFNTHFNQIITNLIFELKNNTKIIAITSTVEGEGKTFIASEIVKKFSEDNFKVLLVDMGKNNAVSNIFNVKLNDKDEHTNIRNYIINKNNFIDILIYPVDKTFDINLNMNIKEILLELRQNYDLILIDSQELMNSPYSNISLNIAEAILYVVGLNKVDKSLLIEAKNKIEMFNKKIVAIVANEF